MDRVKNWNQFNESEQKYPYDDTSILVLSIEYSKSGVKQLSNIQFNNGKLFTEEIYVDHFGSIKIPDMVKTMEDIVDFIFDLSYSPKRFVKIISVKYPSFKSVHTTHLILDEDKTKKITEYLNKKVNE